MKNEGKRIQATAYVWLICISTLKTPQPVLPSYQVSELPFFEQHASRTHELSKIFFENIFENTKLAVKEEPILPEHVEFKTVLDDTDPFEEEYETPIQVNLCQKLTTC